MGGVCFWSCGKRRQLECADECVKPIGQQQPTGVKLDKSSRHIPPSSSTHAANSSGLRQSWPAWAAPRRSQSQSSLRVTLGRPKYGCKARGAANWSKPPSASRQHTARRRSAEASNNVKAAGVASQRGFGGACALSHNNLPFQFSRLIKLFVRTRSPSHINS